jgi:hypothetical protein
MQVFLLGLFAFSLVLTWALGHVPESERRVVPLSLLSTPAGPAPRIADPDEGLVTADQVYRWLRPETARTIQRGIR